MNVLLGVDGSESSFDALSATLDRARAAGDDLTVVVYDAGEGDVGHVTAGVREHLADAGVTAEIRVLGGDPGGKLVSLADAGYDRLVLGGGTHSPCGKIRLGPVVEFVLFNVRTPVTLVR